MTKRGKKNAQVTIFIIIGLVVLVSVALYFIFINKKVSTTINSETEPISLYVDNCVRSTGEDAIYFNSLHGGYYHVPQESMDLEIPYFVLERTIKIPDRDTFEEELFLYMVDYLRDCTSFE